MSKVNVRVWNRNKIRSQTDIGNKVMPEELMGSYISQSKLVDEDTARDLFWAAKSGDVEALDRYFSKAILHNGFECNRLDRHEMSPLHYAAKYNRVEIIKSLLKYGADIDCIGHDDETPIFIAAKYNSIEALRLLIERYGSTSLTNTNGEGPLHTACRHGKMQACQVLLEFSPLLINNVDKDKMSALHLACMKGKSEICALLLEKGATLNEKAIDGSMPIHYAAAKGSVELINILLDHSNYNFPEIEQINASDNDQQTPLHRAAQKGRIEAIKLCLKIGSDIHAAQRDGQTPLHIAAASGQIEAVKVLIESGAHVEARDKFYNTAFHIAASCGHISIIKILLENGASVSNMDGKRKSALLHAIEKGKSETVTYLLNNKADYLTQDDRNRSSLHIAAIHNRVAILEELLKRGANSLINEVDSLGRAAIHYAAESGSYEVLRLLISRGGNLDVVDDDDNSPLHLACRSGSLQSIQVICQNGPSLINSIGDRSRTPLHVAVISGHLEAIQYLLNYGADAAKRDGSYITPIEIAVNKGYTSIVELLLNHGISPNIANSKGETILHTAAARGFHEIAKLLVDYGADTLATDENKKTSLDYAIEHRQEMVAIILFKHKYGRQLLLNVNKDGITTMQYMIRHLPSVAKIVMDSCIETHVRDIVRTKNGVEKQMETSYDFSLVDPGPEFELQGQHLKKRNNNNALTTMMEYKNVDLLRHPLAEKLRELKWRKFGQYFYYINLGVYLIFLICLSCYGIIAEDYRVYYMPREAIRGLGLKPGTGISSTVYTVTPTVDASYRQDLYSVSVFVPDWLSSSISDNHLQPSKGPDPNLIRPSISHSIDSSLMARKRQGKALSDPNITPSQVVSSTNQPSASISKTDAPPTTQSDLVTTYEPLPDSPKKYYAIFDTPIYAFMETCMTVFAYINVVLEAYQLFHQRLNYFKSFSNYLDIALYSLLLAATNIANYENVLNIYTILIFLAYVNLLFHMERLDFIGIYILMLQSVMATVLKISGIVFILALAFGISFYTLNPTQSTYYSIPISTVTVLNMMIGEMEYTDSWMSQIQKNKIPLPKSVTALVMIVIFIFLMPIVLTNLMVGLAVGDIDKVRREAGFRLLSSRVEYLDDLERTLPLRFRNRFYKRGHTDKYTKKLNQADNKNMESTSTINKSDITSADPKFVSAIERIGNQEKRIEFLTEQFMAFREDVMKSFKKIDEALNIDQI